MMASVEESEMMEEAARGWGVHTNTSLKWSLAIGYLDMAEEHLSQLEVTEEGLDSRLPSSPRTYRKTASLFHSKGIPTLECLLLTQTPFKMHHCPAVLS